MFITRSNEGRTTSFHYRDSGQNGAYYWNEKDVGYVVSGPAERDELLTVARSVYDQLP
ncbi:hypothetical protein D3C83_244940 [compost metagenome]